MNPSCFALLLAIIPLCWAPGSAAADESVVTVLADFETDSVTTRISEVHNVLASDCRLQSASIPARSGQNSLHVSIGATRANTSVACSLRFRAATLFERADRVATYCHLNDGEIELAFRVRDADGRLFETEATRLRAQRRFVRVSADLNSGKLRAIGADDHQRDATPVWPIQIDGYRISTNRIGRQDVFLEDLQVEHKVATTEMVRGEFRFDNPTRLYQPESTVKAGVIVENLSRSVRLDLSVQLAWERADGSVLRREDQRVRLPPGGDDYRAQQTVEFRERVGDPGVYRLIATVRDPTWPASATFATSFAVTPSNRALSRGRETFFGLRSNLLREPAADQRLELAVARELGVQLLVLDTPWSQVEPDEGTFQLDALVTIIDQLIATDIAPCLALTDPPSWLPLDRDAQSQKQAAVFAALIQRLGKRVGYYQALRLSGDTRPANAIAAELQSQLGESAAAAIVLSPATTLADAEPGGVVATSGDPDEALEAIRAFARAHVGAPPVRWQHRAPEITGSGTPADAEAIFRAYVGAAEARLGGLVWCDLRDDSDDPRHPQDHIGLLRRDFSPRTAALGYTTAVGMLAGLRHAGPLSGTPEEFESALFVSATRQVAVLFPKPAAHLPATLAPVALVEGDVQSFDFSRQEHPIIRSVAPPLITTLERPLFITLEPSRATTEPALALTRPWIEAPREVFVDRAAECELTLTAPFELSRTRSYLRLSLPNDVPLESSLDVVRLQALAGSRNSFHVTLDRKDASSFDSFRATWRLVLEGERIELPLIVSPRLLIHAVSGDQALATSDQRIAALEQVGANNPTADVPIHAAYAADRLQFAVPAPDHVMSGATLHLTVSFVGGAAPIRIDVDAAWAKPELAPSPGDAPGAREGVSVRKIRAHDRDFCVIEIAPPSLGRARWNAGDELRLGARIQEPGLSTILRGRVFQFGGGFDDADASSELVLAILGE